MSDLINIHIGPYLDISNDRVFKRVFGKPANKDLLILLLNLVIEEITIVDLEYISNEFQGFDIDSEQSRMDLRVKTDKGYEIIVEVQVRDQSDFPDRAVYYASLPILEEVEKGDSNYRLSDRIMVSFLQFSLPHKENAHWDGECRSVYSIREKCTNEKLSNAMNFVFVELGRFTKPIENLDNDLERFYFCIKHMGKFEEIPREMKSSQAMKRLFEAADLESLTPTEKHSYIRYMTTERDIRNQIEFAVNKGIERGREEGRAEGHAEGRAEGRAEGHAEGFAEGIAEGEAEGIIKGKLEIAKAMKAKGLSDDVIEELTGLHPSCGL